MAVKWITLQEEANELGFEDIETALNGGYEVEYRNDIAHLIKKKGE